MTRLISHIRSNAVAYLALFVALGGTSYAAIKIPDGSVGTRQLKNGAITPPKLSSKYFNGSVRAWAVITGSGKLDYGVGKPSAVITGYSPSTYEIRWGARFSKNCATVANVDSQGTAPTETVSVPGDPSLALPAGYVVVSNSGRDRTSGLSATTLTTFNQAGQPTPMTFDVAVIC